MSALMAQVHGVHAGNYSRSSAENHSMDRAELTWIPRGMTRPPCKSTEGAPHPSPGATPQVNKSRNPGAESPTQRRQPIARQVSRPLDREVDLFPHNPDMLNIVEIIRRSDQGVTRPFLCRCDDDRLYFVKGRDAGTRSLLCEWLAGHLAKAFGLPIAHFSTAQAPPGLVALFPDGNGLGADPAFASLLVEHSQELSQAHLRHVDSTTQRDLLVFDWWIHNPDRTLTSAGGNPNLLWNPMQRRLAVIDHNLAFDRGFEPHLFSLTHVFAKRIPEVFQDLVRRTEYIGRLRDALAAWPDACHNVPEEWWYVDAERTVPTDFDPAAMLTHLSRFRTEDFWSVPP